jgi:asparagine synthase (glutamine-hydrolysing)
MCGIAGAFSHVRNGGQVDRAIVAALNDLHARRGPDGAGTWSSEDERLVLAHRRLAIIDTGPSGAQPMADQSGRWVITFNGEIYNYQALRAELTDEGCVFRTGSDTEVLINVVARWGAPGLQRLRGMYAFALWDTREKELWLARDPYGIKPLYTAQAGGTLWFSSQARSLARCAPVDARRDAAALVGFYLWGHVPEPFSWWRGIQMFPAGHVQRIRFGQALDAPRPFTRIQDLYTRAEPRPLAPGELHGVLSGSVRDHLVADVPVGIFLSAGIDSNVIAALAAEHTDRLCTVTLAFDEYAGTPHDEAPLAEAAAKALKSDHATVRIDRERFDSMVDDFVQSMDQPTIDGLNTYLVSHAAATRGLKVALSGLGGDELFGGYPSFRQIPRMVTWGRRIPARAALGRGLQKLLRSMPLWLVPPKAAGLLACSGDVASAFLLRRALYLTDELDALLDESWLTEGLERLATHRALAETLGPLAQAGAGDHAQISALESCWYMRNQLLRDTDWSSMAHGLEVRVPFVDVRVLERLGPAIASPSPPTKQDLAACVAGLPAGVAARPKTGFTTPVRDWAARTDASPRGLRGWASDVHRRFRGLRAAAA